MKYVSNIIFRKLRIALAALFLLIGIVGLVEGNWFAVPVLVLAAFAIYYYLGKVYHQVELQGKELIFSSSKASQSIPLDGVESISQGGFGIKGACLTVSSKSSRVLLWPELSSKRLEELLELIKENNPNVRVSVNTLK